MNIGREGVDGPRELGVGLQFLLLGHEVVVGLGLLEGCLAVLADHDEGREKDGLQRHHQRQLRPGVGLHEQHPQGEDHGVDVDELHRSGEGGDGVGDPQLQVGGATGLVRHHDRVVLGVRVEPIHGHPLSGLDAAAGASEGRRPPLPWVAHAPASSSASMRANAASRTAYSASSMAAMA